jgi:hypothetical protein
MSRFNLEILPIKPIASTDLARKKNCFLLNLFLTIVIEDGVGWNED